MKDEVLSQTRSHSQGTAEADTCLDIEFPSSCAILPGIFIAGGTIPAGMFVRACYFECGSTRTDADKMKNSGGRWMAIFLDVPPCDDTGKLTVEATTLDGTDTSTDYHDKLLVINPLEYLDKPTAVMGPLQVHLGTPTAGKCVPPDFTAQGSLDGGTKAVDCYFLCTSTTPNVKTDMFTISSGSRLWQAKFQTVPLCDKGTVTVVGDDSSSDSNGNISVKTSCP